VTGYTVVTVIISSRREMNQVLHVHYSQEDEHYCVTNMDVIHF
jgi:hypothetical protein